MDCNPSRDDKNIVEINGMIIRINPDQTGSVIGSDIDISECIIPDFVTEISESAFAFRQRLKKVICSDSVKRICARAFEGSRNLEEIKISESLISIGARAFCFCLSLKDISIPESVVSIEEYAFEDCALTTISIPKDVKNIGEGAFDSRYLCSIGVAKENKFFHSEEGVLFDKTMTNLIRYPMNKKGSKYIIPEGVAHLEKRSFFSSDNLNEVTLPHSLIRIGQQAFELCDELETINISDSITKIEYISLLLLPIKEVRIPKNLSSLGNGVFNICKKLSFFEVDEDSDLFSVKDGVLFDKEKKTLIR